MPIQAVLPADPTATIAPPGTTTTVEPGFAAALDAETGTGSPATPPADTPPPGTPAADTPLADTPAPASQGPGAQAPGTIPATPTATALPAAATPAGPAMGGLGQLRTVSLGVMVGALANGPSASVTSALAGAPVVPAAPAGVQTAAVSDAWGATAARPAGAGGRGQAVLDAGERYLGVPYKWGGTSARTGFDCSGFVQQVYQDLGIKLPRVSADQARAGTAVAGGLDNAQPGDLVFWRGNGSRPNHIGIYAGEGRMLVAPRTGDVVKYQKITRTPDGIRRVI